MNGVLGRRSSPRAGSAALLPMVLGAVSDVVLQTGPDGGVEWISPSVTDVLGYRPDDLVGRRGLDLVHPEDVAQARLARARLREGAEAAEAPLRFAAAGGGWRDVQARAHPLRVGGELVGALVTLRDEHEARATRRALATVLAGNAVLVHAETPDDLLRDMCQAIVTAGGYAFCWYGRPDDDEARTVRPVVVGGDDRGYVSAIRVSWDAASPLGQGPTGVCLRTGTTQVRDDLATDPRFAPWLDAASGRGIHCNITLPVFVDGRVDGALMVYATDVAAFGPLAQEMLQGLAADLGYGLQRLVEVDRRLQAEERFRLMAENATDVVFLADGTLTWQWVSSSAATVLGWDAEALVGSSGTDYLHPDDLAQLRADMADAGPEQALNRRLRFRQPDGSYRWVSAAGRSVLDAQGRPHARVVSMRDISAEVAKEEALEASEALFRLLAEHALDMVVRSDPGDAVTWVSPSAREVLGWDPADLVGPSAASLIHPDDLPALQRAGPAAADAGRPVLEVRARARDGSWRWLRDTVRLVRDEQGRVTARIDTFRDIDAEVEARMRLAYETGHDPLTGLLNRRALFATLDDLLAVEPAGSVALLTVGVDGLKAVNDAYTHTAGDRVLVQVAARLAEAVGDRNRLARIGDTDFGVVMVVDAEDDAGDDTVTALAASLVETGAGTVALGSHDIPVTVSVGIARTEGSDSSELMRDASAALHQARAAGGNRWDFHDPAAAAAARQRLTAVSALHRALSAAAMRPWFQPIVSLADGRTVGYEALARRVDDDGRVIPPVEFLPVAEHSGLVVAVDRAVRVAALDVLARLPDHLHMSVNVAAATLATPGFADALRHELARAGVAATRLSLEVTETSLVRITQEVLDAMRSVADLGVTWWVDDFGTGYSSISHLRDMPIGGLKLDRSFTAGILGPDQTHRRLAQGLAGLAAGLGLRTVAEGVETREQAEVLAGQGWRFAQGFLYGAPTTI